MKYLQAVNVKLRPRLEWTLATTLGFVVGMGLSTTLFVLPIRQDINTVTPLAISLNILSMIFIGMSVGLAQSYVLRKHIPEERWWTLATTLGWVVSLFVAEVLFIALANITTFLSLVKFLAQEHYPLDIPLLSIIERAFSFQPKLVFELLTSHPFQSFLDYSDIVDMMGRFLLSLDKITVDQLSIIFGPGFGLFSIAYIALFGSAFGAVIGGIVGSVQTIVLRRLDSKPRRWIMPSVSGWASGWALSLVIILISHIFESRIISISTAVTGTVFIGILVGVFTGKELESWIQWDTSTIQFSPIKSAFSSLMRLGVRARILALIGIVFLLLTVSFGIFLFSAQVGANLFGGIESEYRMAATAQAAELRINQSSLSSIERLDLRNLNTIPNLRNQQFSACNPAINIKADKITMKEKEAAAISIGLSNPSSQECFVEARLYTPNFDYKPDDEVLSTNLAPGGSSSLGWVISPKTTGAYQIEISIQVYSFQPSTIFGQATPNQARVLGSLGPNIGYTKYIGVVVTNTLGFTAEQAALFTYVGTFFGSSFTFPWLYTVWKEQRKSSSEEKKQGNKRKQKQKR